jgi:hypothetical protein
VIELTKDVVRLVKDIQNIELLQKMCDLQNEVFALNDTNRTLREQVTNMERALALRDRLVFEGNFYWLRDGDKRDGPYCMRCYDREKDARRMVAFDRGNEFGCPSCTLVLSADGEDVDAHMLARLQRALIQIKPR